MKILPEITLHFFKNPITFFRFYKRYKKKRSNLSRQALLPPLLMTIAAVMYCTLQPYILFFNNILFFKLPDDDFLYIRSLLTVGVLIYAGYKYYDSIRQNKYPSLYAVSAIISIVIMYYFLFRGDKNLFKFCSINVLWLII
jgi:hypothetical protein